MSEAREVYEDRRIRVAYPAKWKRVDSKGTAPGQCLLRPGQRIYLLVEVTDSNGADIYRDKYGPHAYTMDHMHLRYLGDISAASTVGTASEATFVLPDGTKQPLYCFGYVEHGDEDNRLVLELQIHQSAPEDSYRAFVDQVTIEKVDGGTCQEYDNSVVDVTHNELNTLTTDGGPHLLLPHAFQDSWQGLDESFDPLDPAGDFGRACAALGDGDIAAIAVGDGVALVINDHSTWTCSDINTSRDQMHIYIPKGWGGEDIVVLMEDAQTNRTKGTYANTGIVIDLPTDGVTHMYAGDSPGETAYGQYRLPLKSGRYRVEHWTYAPAREQSVEVYRLSLIA